jgi:hypothetical protein
MFMGMLSGGRNYDDMDRFYDPCSENRTEKQILWEEGIYKDGSLRSKFAESFGRNDISKLGRKTATAMMVVLLWNLVGMVIQDDGIVKMILQCGCVTLTAFAEMWDYRGKDFTPLNWGYIVLLAVLSSGFYSLFDFLFGGWGYNAITGAYIFLYTISPAFGFAIRIITAIAAIVAVIKCYSENKYTVIAKALCVVSIFMGIPMLFFTGNEFVITIGMIVTILFVFAVFLLNIKAKSNFIRNMTFVFIFYAMVDVMGYMDSLINAVVD